ncbi:MAG TPA: ArsA-related P-loop ATPase [Myxococcaceae bacterium]|nr:ArsA-related P-loop ATPase [Myxococcaceae bacterium]
MSHLLDRRFWMVSGKGGVGKSATAAALALASARRGRRTLICEVNADERIPPLLGHAPVGPEVTRLEEHLWSVNLRPAEAMKEYVLMTLKLEALYRAVFENRLVRSFLRFIPSIQELVLLGKATWHVRETDDRGRHVWDTVVLDGPATGHFVSFVSVPQVLMDTVPPGPIRRDAEIMRGLLVDPAITGAVLVALPEELPVTETLELATSLRERVSLPLVGGVLNTWVSERFDAGMFEQLSEWPRLKELARAQHAAAERSRWALDKLQGHLGAPVHKVPRIYSEQFGREQIERMSRALEPLVAGSADHG